MAQVFRHFGGDTLGAAPSGFTAYGAEPTTWTVEALAASENGQALRQATSGNLRKILVPDSLGAIADLDVIVKVRTTNTGQDQLGIVGRHQTGDGSLYVYELFNADRARLAHWASLDATFTGIHNVAAEFAWVADTWYYLRLLVVGTSFKVARSATLADVSDGTRNIPPGGWAFDGTNSLITAAGLWGLGTRAGAGIRYFDWVSWGTAGDAAPTAAAATADPTSLTVTISGTTAALSWPAPSMATADNTDIFRRGPYATAAEVPTTPFDPAVDTRIARVPVATLTYDDVGLAAGHYAWQVFPVDAV